jgi:hypothetical protein
MMRKRKITSKEQEIAAKILTQFMFAINMEEVIKTWNDIYNQYELHDDPFTHTPCSSNDYYRNRMSFDRQTMIDRYGHCDGLE